MNISGYQKYTPTHRVGAILKSPCPSVRPSVHTFVTDISASTGRNDFIFDIWLWHGDLYHVTPFQVYRTSTYGLQCDLEFFMFAVVNENFRNSYLSFYWKKWFYIWYMAFAWWLVLCLPFPGLPHIYFLFTVRLTNEWARVFLARRSVHHLVIDQVCLRGSELKKIIYLGFVPSGGHWAKRFYFFKH